MSAVGPHRYEWAGCRDLRVVRARIGEARLIGEHGRDRMSGAAAREIRKPDEGPLHAFANAMSGGVLLALAGRVGWGRLSLWPEYCNRKCRTELAQARPAQNRV